MNTLKIIVTATGILLLTACASLATSPTAKPSPPTEPNTTSITCGDERPQMCTREYRPVCGKRDTEVRCVTTPCPNVEYKTYGNACTACADSKVIDYASGECDKPNNE